MRPDPLETFVRTAAPEPVIDPARVERLAAAVFARLDAGEAAAPPRRAWLQGLIDVLRAPDAWRYAAPMAAAAVLGGVFGRTLADAAAPAVEASAAHNLLVYTFTTTTWF